MPPKAEYYLLAKSYELIGYLYKIIEITPAKKSFYLVLKGSGKVENRLE